MIGLHKSHSVSKVEGMIAKIKYLNTLPFKRGLNILKILPQKIDFI
jgi:hypothetical protein